jgi:hypothetical protein
MKGTIISKAGIIFVVVFVLLSGCVSDPVVQKGTISLTSSPSGAQVYLDNQHQGSTPLTIPDLALGSHKLEYHYLGYKSWSTVITVTPGSSNYYAELVPQATTRITSDIAEPVTPATTQAAITLWVGKNPMQIGESNLFSGTAVGTNTVLLTLYGPGKYSNGVSLVQQNVNELGQWSYTWNPGSSVQSGSYTMVVSDPWKTTSNQVDFTVIGGGLVSISPSTYSAAKGTSVTFSGQCTTGAQNVILVLYGPYSYSGGAFQATLPVLADKTWKYQFSVDSTMYNGVYTMYVYDVPRTTSGNVQFTIGYMDSS